MKITRILSGDLYTFINIIEKNNIYDTNHAVIVNIHLQNHSIKLRVNKILRVIFIRTRF